MSAAVSDYNPLDYGNLTRNCVDELMPRRPFALPLGGDFVGAGIYAIFYKGSAEINAKVRSSDSTWPIYMGKSVSPGGRKGGSSPGRASVASIAIPLKQADLHKTRKMHPKRQPSCSSE